eukprot:Trichotokara_eunicae@DN5262_c0_g1_i1.p1
MFCIAGILRSNYYATAVTDIQGQQGALIYSILQSFTFVVTPIQGYLADRIGLGPIFFMINLSGIIAYALILPGRVGLGLGVTSSVFWFYSTSFLGAGHYCQLLLFPQQHVGKVNGVIMGVSGAISLTIPLLYSLCLRKDNFSIAAWVMLSLGLVVVVTVSFHIKAERQIKKRKNELKEKEMVERQLEQDASINA